MNLHVSLLSLLLLAGATAVTERPCLLVAVFILLNQHDLWVAESVCLVTVLLHLTGMNGDR